MHRRSISLSLVVTVAVALTALAMPPATSACSCVAPDDMLRGAGQDPQTVVLTGEAGMPTPAGLPVTVSRWFAGPGVAPIVFLDVERLEESSCGTTAPPAGHEYLFVLWRDDTGRFAYHACSVAADLDTDDGQARLAQAVAQFGPASTPEPPGTPASAPDPMAAVGVIGPFVMVLLGGLILLLGVIAGLRRTRFGRG